MGALPIVGRLVGRDLRRRPAQAATTVPSLGWLIPAVLATLVVVTGLTALPAWVGSRRPLTDVLAQEAS
ncbi:MAG TPA: hypothetical protein VGI58_00085 [Streptosporangiaceae bacterium]|jgi:hypothetical protein